MLSFLILLLAAVVRFVSLAGVLYFVYTDYDTLISYPKTFIKLLIIILQTPKNLMRIFVYFEQCVFFEMHFRAYFDSYELERKRIVSRISLTSPIVLVPTARGLVCLPLLRPPLDHHVDVLD